jgi:hypothetical protein
MRDDSPGKVMFYSLSLRGHCYISSPEGSVYLVELSPLPRLVEVVDQRRFAEADNISEQRITSLALSSSAAAVAVRGC